MTREEAIDLSGGEDLLFWDGCDDAIVGVGTRCAAPMLVIYDYEKLVQVFVAKGMEDSDAEEWIQFNIIGAWVGDKTPIVMESPR